MKHRLEIYEELKEVPVVGDSKEMESLVGKDDDSFTEVIFRISFIQNMGINKLTQ
jgi:hypothetical protein